MKEESQKERGTLGESLLRISLLILGVAVIAALVIPTGKNPVREPMEVRQSSVMKQIALAIEMYELEYREELPINDLDEVRSILGGKNGRKRVYFEESPYQDQYGRSFVIDKGQIVHLGDDGVLGTDDDIRAVVKRQ